MNYSVIKKSVTETLNSLPSGVTLVAATKTKFPEEVRDAIYAVIRIVGYNYVQFIAETAAIREL